jgi:NADH dehydrogenase
MRDTHANRIVTVFGGTGFVGRRIVKHLYDHEFLVRIASRHPDRAGVLFGEEEPRLQPMMADIHDDASVAAAIADGYGVVNAISLYVERGTETFHSVHVEAAARIARHACDSGIKRLVHISGIGADSTTHSPYICSRGRGEVVVRAEFPDAIIVRSAAMFGPDDAFLTAILQHLRRLPAYPMFGRGSTRLQPAYVEDVAEAIARCVGHAETSGTIFECGGPRIYSYSQLLKAIAREAGLRPILFPMPFAVWHALAFFAELLPNPPVTRNQVELMQIDNIASPEMPGFGDLSISPSAVEQFIHHLVGAT